MVAPPVILYRVGHWFHLVNLKMIGVFFSYLNRLLFSVWIPSSAKIGKNFKIGYWGLGIVIHSDTEIGNNCIVAQNVTIGRNFGDKKVPIIGDNVYIGAGSSIIGEITIGNNVIVGVNSVITKSVPDNVIVAGNPGKILKQNKVPYFNLDKLPKKPAKPDSKIIH